MKQQCRDHRKQQIARPTWNAEAYNLPCKCGGITVIIADRNYCHNCWWLQGIGSHWLDAVQNVTDRLGLSLYPKHSQKPAYYQWRHHTKSDMSRSDWMVLQSTDCALCGSRSWHEQWNRPELRDGSWINLCKCCAIMSEPFPSLADFQQHCQKLV